MRKPTTYITLTSINQNGGSEVIHVWGFVGDFADKYQKGMCYVVLPVVVVSRESDPFGLGAIKTATRSYNPSFVAFDQVVSFTPGPDIEEVEAGAA